MSVRIPNWAPVDFSFSGCASRDHWQSIYRKWPIVNCFLSIIKSGMKSLLHPLQKSVTWTLSRFGLEGSACFLLWWSSYNFLSARGMTPREGGHSNGRQSRARRQSRELMLAHRVRGSLMQVGKKKIGNVADTKQKKSWLGLTWKHVTKTKYGKTSNWMKRRQSTVNLKWKSLRYSARQCNRGTVSIAESK